MLNKHLVRGVPECVWPPLILLPLSSLAQNDILRIICDSPHSVNFISPVSKQVSVCPTSLPSHPHITHACMQVVDYSLIVRLPMDLGAMRAKSAHHVCNIACYHGMH